MDLSDEEVSFKPREERMKDIRRRRKEEAEGVGLHSVMVTVQATSPSPLPSSSPHKENNSDGEGNVRTKHSLTKSCSKPLSDRSVNMADIDAELACLKEAVENLERDLTTEEPPKSPPPRRRYSSQGKASPPTSMPETILDVDKTTTHKLNDEADVPNPIAILSGTSSDPSGLAVAETCEEDNPSIVVVPTVEDDSVAKRSDCDDQIGTEGDGSSLSVVEDVMVAASMEDMVGNKSDPSKDESQKEPKVSCSLIDEGIDEGDDADDVDGTAEDPSDRGVSVVDADVSVGTNRTENGSCCNGEEKEEEDMTMVTRKGENGVENDEGRHMFCGDDDLVRSTKASKAADGAEAAKGGSLPIDSDDEVVVDQVNGRFEDGTTMEGSEFGGEDVQKMGSRMEEEDKYREHGGMEELEGPDSVEVSMMNVEEIVGLDVSEFGMYTEAEVEAERRKAASAAESEVAILSGRLEATKLELDAERGEMRKLRDQFESTVEKMSSEMSSKNLAEATALRMENEKLVGELKASADAFNNLKSRYGKFKEAVIKYDSQEKELIAQIRTLRKSLGDLEIWNRDFKSHAEKKLQQAFEQVCSYKAQLKTKSEEAEELTKDRNAKEDQLRTAGEQIQRLIADKETLHVELNQLQESTASRTKVLEQERNQLRDGAKESESKLAKTVEECNQLKVRIFDAMQTIDNLSNRRTSDHGSSERTAALEQENSDLKALCEELLVKLEAQEGVSANQP